MPNAQNKNKFIRLLNYSGNYKYLTILGCVLSTISTIFLLIPFVYITALAITVALTLATGATTARSRTPATPKMKASS